MCVGEDEERSDGDQNQTYPKRHEVKVRINMRKIIVTEFVTLDGVMEDPGGADKSKHGGWAFQFDRGPEGDKFKLDEVLVSGALLLGRVTFEGFAAAWPSRTGEFADKMNSMPKYVVSTTLEEAKWNNSRLIKSNVVEELSKLKAMQGSGDQRKETSMITLPTASSSPKMPLMSSRLAEEYGSR